MRGNTYRPYGGGQAGVIAPEDARHEVHCFADEVVIDFPAVAPAVDRMRRAFLGEERPVTFYTAIQLPRRDATAGATVPLEVQVRCTCAYCGGRGESWAESCTRCEGRGIELLPHLLQVTVPAGVHDGACFSFTVTPRHSPPTRVELLVELTD
jgi:hypothetical protein